MMASAIIVAGGQGRRLGASTPKQYLLLGSRPILAYSLIAFGACRSIDSLCLVVPEADLDRCRREIVQPLKMGLNVHLVPGGPRRQDSVYSGLCSLADSGGVVVIHDGVRPFVHVSQIETCIQKVAETGACILAVPAADTLKSVNSSGVIERTLERRGIWQAQTPQAFSYDLIRRAHEAAIADGIAASDDALLVERLGGKVKVVMGDRKNFKITTVADLEIAREMINLLQVPSGRA